MTVIAGLGPGSQTFWEYQAEEPGRLGLTSDLVEFPFLMHLMQPYFSTDNQWLQRGPVSSSAKLQDVGSDKECYYGRGIMGEISLLNTAFVYVSAFKKLPTISELD